LVPRLDVDALTTTLSTMLADPGRLRDMGRAARARAERLLTWDRSAARLERVYLSLVSAPSMHLDRVASENIRH
jgi:glycosyltransferase involved in cell wall biosynthesis